MSASVYLEQFLFPKHMHYQQIEKLSGGEKRRLHLMRVLMQNPNFLILDEPTNDLDIQSLTVLENYLYDFQGCLIVVSHDRFFMDRLVDQSFIFGDQEPIQIFPGNYSLYRESSIQENCENKKNRKAKDVKPKPKTQEKSKKLSYKEKIEFENLNKELEDLGAVKQQLENQLNSGSLSGAELIEKSKSLQDILNKIDEKEMRWLELSELEN